MARAANRESRSIQDYLRNIGHYLDMIDGMLALAVTHAKQHPQTPAIKESIVAAQGATDDHRERIESIIDQINNPVS